MGKSDKILFHWVVECLRCPACNNKLSVTTGKINNEPAFIIQCQGPEVHHWMIQVQLNSLSPTSEIKMTPADQPAPEQKGLDAVEVQKMRLEILQKEEGAKPGEKLHS